MGEKSYDIFISHAAEDKDGFIRPLVDELVRLKLKVWYAELSLRLGDSLSASVDRGLKESRYGLVVLSPSFFAKSWPEYGYRSLLTPGMGQGKLILPIWHNVGRDQVIEFSPNLADKLAVSTRGNSIRHVALEILRVVFPERYDATQRYLALQAWRTELPVEEIPLEKVSLGGPIRHADLPESLLRRIQLMQSSLYEIFPVPLEGTIKNFQRDLHPENELEAWERVAAIYNLIRNSYNLDQAQKKRLFRSLLAMSMEGDSTEEINEGTKLPVWLRDARDEFLRT